VEVTVCEEARLCLQDCFPVSTGVLQCVGLPCGNRFGIPIYDILRKLWGCNGGACR
jgi:hypothetical protein